MKWFIVTALVISATLAAAKSTDNKSPIKKASSVKPTKNPKSILESFSGLSTDDTKFIKELDKQFKEHGDKIKIKVENDKTAKNPKRTIDGDLGYGYHQNQNSGFYFSQPKFMVYPYSQEDIPPLRYQTQQQSRPQSHRHTITKTHVQIQPSQGYEIKEEEPAQYYSAGNQQQYQQLQPQQPQQPQQPYQLPNYHYQQQQQQGPVIVLRIPGPAKYATHLQALLQQYLEIRAAQYIEALQEQEAAGQQHNSQSPVPQQVTPEYQAPMYLPNNQGTTTSLRDTGPHQYPTSQPAPFKISSSQVFHQQQQQIQQQQHQQQIEQQQQQIQHQQQSQQVYPAQAIYEEHQVEVSPAPQYHDSEVQVQVQGEVEYQQQPEHFAQQQAYEAAQQQQQHQQIEHQQQEQPQGYQYESPEHSGLQTSENFPSQHHTQVIFRKNQHHQQQQQQIQDHQQQQQIHEQQQQQQQIHEQQQQQQIQEQQQHVAYEQQAQPEQQYYEESGATPQYHQQSHFYQPHEVEFTASSHEAVSITPKAPFGFHSHEVESTSASPSKRAAPFSEQQFKKFNKLITKLKKKSAELKAARGE